MRRLALAALLLTAVPLLAGPKVAIVVGPSVPKLERFAADEMAAQLRQLFDADVTVGDKPVASEHVILLGSPATNPAVKDAIGGQWPKNFDDQGHLLRSTPKGLVVGGTTAVATLWAAYELGHHFGIRAFLHGDVYPEKAPPLELNGINLTYRPVTKVRGWVVSLSSPLEFGGWSLDEYKRFLGQLAKLKFNAIEVRPIELWEDIPVSGDTPGRKAFRGAKVFENPELAKGADDPTAKDQLLKNLTIAAEQLGLHTGKPSGTYQELGSMRVLPQAFTQTDLDGAVLRSAVPGDEHLWAYALSRGGFEPGLENKDTVASLYAPSLGAASAERVALGMQAIAAVHLIALKEDRDGHFGTASPTVVADALKAAAPPPEWWKETREKYAEAMNEMYRGIRATFNEPARAPLLYHAKRCEFAVNYIAAMEATRLAGVAKAKGDKEATVMHLEKAVESMYNALNAYGDVARDPGDRGVIAVLNRDVYRPLKAVLKAAEKK